MEKLFARWRKEDFKKSGVEVSKAGASGGVEGESGGVEGEREDCDD
jgi:hypothetical protein